MANELTINVSARYVNGTTDETIALATALSRTVTGNKIVHQRVSVATSEQALSLGGAGVGGYLFGVNRDATNYMEIRGATGGLDLVKLLAGDVCLFRISGDSTAPFVIANTGAVDFEYWLIIL